MPTSVASPRSATESTLRGDEHPRLEVCPPYDYSLGPDVIALAALAGLDLDFWQQQALVMMCAVRGDKWACFEYLEVVARQNGKGSIIEARALAGLLLFDEKLILWSAHEYKTAMEGFRRFGDLLRKLGRSVGQNLILIDDGEGQTITIKVNNTNGEEAYERLDTGQRLKFIARSKGSGRGFSPDVMIVDEAMFYTPLQHEALLPSLSARPNPQIIYMSSPPLDGDTGEILFTTRDRVEEMLKDAEVAAGEALGARIWGGEGDLDHLDELDLDDPRLLAMANPAMPMRITFKTVIRERKSMRANGGRGYARERLGIWPLPRLVAGGRIKPEKWQAVQDPESERDTNAGVALGVEISPDFAYAAIVLYGMRADGLGHVQLVDRRSGITWVTARLLKLIKKHQPVAIGMSRVTYAALETELTRVKIRRPEDRANDPDDPDTAPRAGDLLVTSAAQASAACGQLIVAVEEESLKVKPHPEYPEILDEAALGAKTKRVGDSIVWSRAQKDDEAEISPVGAMTSARYAYLARVDVVVDNRVPNLW